MRPRCDLRVTATRISPAGTRVKLFDFVELPRNVTLDEDAAESIGDTWGGSGGHFKPEGAGPRHRFGQIDEKYYFAPKRFTSVAA